MDFEDDFQPPDIDPDEDDYLNENFDVPDGKIYSI